MTEIKEAVNQQENMTAENAIVKASVINNEQTINGLTVEYNGSPVTTQENFVKVLRTHYRLMVLRKYGIVLRDDEGNPVKNVLVINGITARPRIPAIQMDENGAATEDLEQYYNRTVKKAGGAYSTVLKGLERIDFVSERI